MKAKLIKASTWEGQEQIQIYKHSRPLLEAMCREPEERDPKPFTVVVTTGERKYINYKETLVTSTEEIRVTPDYHRLARNKRPSKKLRTKPMKTKWKNDINKLQNKNVPYYPKRSSTIVREQGNSEVKNYGGIDKVWAKNNKDTR